MFLFFPAQTLTPNTLQIINKTKRKQFRTSLGSLIWKGLIDSREKRENSLFFPVLFTSPERRMIYWVFIEGKENCFCLEFIHTYRMFKKPGVNSSLVLGSLAAAVYHGPDQKVLL